MVQLLSEILCTLTPRYFFRQYLSPAHQASSVLLNTKPRCPARLIHQQVVDIIQDVCTRKRSVAKFLQNFEESRTGILLPVTMQRKFYRPLERHELIYQRTGTVP